MAVAEVSFKEFHTSASSTLELDKVCLESLELNANTGYDGFGRPKAQPIAVNVTVFLNQVISSAASVDGLDRSTVHYGELSKAVLKRLEEVQPEWQSPVDLLEHIMSTALSFANDRSAVARIDSEVCFKNSSVTSTVGSSLSLYSNYLANTTCLVFALKNMVLPALIGVNSHERQMRQQITVSVWIDRLNDTVANECYQVEQIIVKTVEESTFETLEALCETMAANVIKFFVLARRPSNPSVASESMGPAGVRIRIGKPFAVALAKSATVEVYRSAGIEDAFGRRMLAELGSKRPQIPFPLQGRLDEFLRSWKQD